MSGFICGAWKKIVDGPMNARRTLVLRCDEPLGHKGDHVDNVVYVNWSDAECAPESYPRNEWNAAEERHD